MEAYLLQLLTATLGALGFSLIFNVRGKSLFFTSLGGFLAWGGYLLLGIPGLGEIVRYLLVSIGVGIYAEVCARRLKAPATVFLVTGAVPLIPGSSLYATMVYAVHMDGEHFLLQGLHTLLLAGAIAAGIILVSTVLHALHAAGRRP
jgi:uncharacterized membrane protein YjjB (DUF3815 family)